MKPPGEIEPTSVFALLAGARCATALVDPSVGYSSPARQTEALTVFTSIDEARTAVEMAASSAQRMISIFTPDLEPDLYDQSAFLEIIKRFVLSRSFSKVRVLLADPARVVRDSNRFAAMGRRLSSYIDIRHISEAQSAARTPAGGHLDSAAGQPNDGAAEDRRGDSSAAAPASPQPAPRMQRPAAATPALGAAAQCGAYLIADDRAVVYRLRADTWDGIADLNNPSVARLYLTEFDALWSRSAPEDALRTARARA